MTGNQMFAELVTMRDTAGENHFNRVYLADQLLKDKAWVLNPSGGGGDEDKAITLLERECFGDLCGFISLPELLDVLHHFPSLTIWSVRKFDVRGMAKEIRRKRRPQSKASRRGDGDFVDPDEFGDLTEHKKLVEYRRVLNAYGRKNQEALRLEQEITRLEHLLEKERSKRRSA